MINVMGWLAVPEGKTKKYIIILIAFALLIVLQTSVLVSTSCNGKVNATGADGSVNSTGTNTGSVAGSTLSGSDVGVVNAGDTSVELDEEHSRIIIVPKLVNSQYVLSSDFKPNNLVKIGDKIKGTPTLQVNATVRQAYLLMQADMKEQGVEVPMIISAYRSYAKQKELYESRIAMWGANQKVSNPPGTSEHQYGAAIDISTDGTCQLNFGNLPTGKWISENSYKYGFVVRYPEGKKEITGINFEPWHIRYVGVEHATAMYEMGLCLEEYVEYLWANYPNAIEEMSSDQFPAPRWAGDTGEDDFPPSSSDIVSGSEIN